MVSAAGEFATTTPVKTAWKKFKELLPILTSHHLSYKTRGRVYSTCVRSAMLLAINLAVIETKSTVVAAQRYSHDTTDLQNKDRDYQLSRQKTSL